MKSYSRENLSQRHFIFKFSKGPLLSIVYVNDTEAFDFEL